jgi:DNA-directed RNA polymerase I subunit RPA34.5
MSKPKGSVTVPLSKEIVSDSEDLDSVDSGTSSEASDESSSSESEQQSKARKRSVSQSDSEEQSEAESEDVDDENAAADVAINASAIDKFTSSNRPVMPFIPPRGFERIRNFSEHVSHDLSEATLKGKEVWRISVPAGLSLDQLQHISLGSIQRSEVVFENHGVQYGLSAENHANINDLQIMMPSKVGYKTGIFLSLDVKLN